MELPKDLVNEFAAATDDTVSKALETTCYGTVRIQNGTEMVQIDGSDIMTPAVFTVAAHVGDRVLVLIKGRKALVIGNITCPVLTLGILKANVGVIVEGYITTNANRTTYNGTNTNGVTIDGNGIGGYGGSGTWYATNNGKFYAESAEISGKITAGSGSIGGYIIGDGKLYTTNHTDYNSNNQGVFISPTYIALGANALSYLKNDGSFQLGGSNGITYANSKVSLGSDTELLANSIKGTKNLGNNWGIDFTNGTITIGEISVSKITGILGSTSTGNWGIDFTNNTMSIGNISANNITTGTLSVDRIGAKSIPNGKLSGTIKDSGNTWSIDLNAGTMTIGNLSANNITTGTLSVDRIGAKSIPNGKLSGTIKDSGNTWSIDLNAGTMTIGNLSANNITTGTLSVDRIAANSIPNGKLSGTIKDSGNTWSINLNTGVLTIGNISANNITTGTLSADRISSLAGFTISGNTMYTAGHSAWNTAANGVFISGSGDYPLSIGSGGAFYVTKQGVPHCNGADLYINSAVSSGDSSGVTIQVGGTTYGTLNVYKATNSYLQLSSPRGGVVIDSASFITLTATRVNVSNDMYLDGGNNIRLYSKATSSPDTPGTDPGDIIFYDSDGVEMGRVWAGSSNKTLYFRSGTNSAGISITGTSVSIGGALTVSGDLTVALTSSTCTLVSSVATSGTITCRKRGNVVTIEGAVTIVKTTARTKMATIPTGYRPANTFYSILTDKATLVVANVNGDLQVDARAAGNIWFTFTYVIG